MKLVKLSSNGLCVLVIHVELSCADFSLAPATDPSGSSNCVTICTTCCSGGSGSDELAWLHPSIFWDVLSRFCLHIGHEECELSHLSMHCTWNLWLHCGKRRTGSPAANSDRHITHSVSDPGNFISTE
ncbi:hypothetical protein HS088_TW02G00829 [Tripterygium wilfordii]|uniref:Secreted protein n=1 Tax=Tripterygium wilfordii TaxID=458696 RepID=A0A7J7DZV6_TRIWF|nr:hypothetical protein HS088_TW02G00829 [Tripterygium wilfordii]